MSEPEGRLIRSYHRAFGLELLLHTIGNLRFWRPVPARGVFYLAVFELVMFALAHTAPGAVSWMGPEVLYGLVPLGAAWLLSVARVEGRRFHVAARAWTRHLFTGRCLVGGYRRMRRPGVVWRPVAIVLIGDGRDGVAPRGLWLHGPGRVLLRYPCHARQDRSTLSVCQTSDVPCDPGRVLEIAAGASARFVASEGGGR